MLSNYLFCPVHSFFWHFLLVYQGGHFVCVYPRPAHLQLGARLCVPSCLHCFSSIAIARPSPSRDVSTQIVSSRSLLQTNICITMRLHQGSSFPTEGKKYGGPIIRSQFWVTKLLYCVGQKAPNIVRQKADDQMILWRSEGCPPPAVPLWPFWIEIFDRSIYNQSLFTALIVLIKTFDLWTLLPLLQIGVRVLDWPP